MLRRAKERYERELASPNESRRKSRYLQEPETIHQLTRSKDKPLQHSTVFFFCDGEEGYQEKLREVQTINGGKSLHGAIELTGNDKLRVKRSLQPV